MAIICTLLGHSRDQARVWHDQIDWRSRCTRCDAPLLKDYRTSKWRAVTEEDMQQERATHHQ